MSADENSAVCLSSSIPDTTPSTWQWSNGQPTKDAMLDAGKAYGAQYFDSAITDCLNNCNATNSLLGRGCGCYDKLSANNPISRLPAIATGNCCGDDP